MCYICYKLFYVMFGKYMMCMKKELGKYVEMKLIVFSVNIKQKQHKNGKWKKNIDFPNKWTEFTTNNTFINNSFNGLALLTGKINNIIVIDIDNVEHWNKLLIENNQKEPDTVKSISGSGGIHYYFEYDVDLENVKSKDHCFGKNYDIDIKTNGGCIIASPTKYYNENLQKNVEYKWEKNIFDNKIAKIPLWIKKLLLIEKAHKVKKEIQCELQNVDHKLQNLEVNQEEFELTYSINDIETIIGTLSNNRCENYNDWISVGICLFNLNNKYLLIWIKWSQKSEKYNDGDCEEKWKSFKKDKNGLKIGSLLMWAKLDNQIKYDEFIRKKKMNIMIKQKYPNDNLILGETIIVNDKCSYTKLNNKECLIKGGRHDNMHNSMYLDVLDKFMTIKCRHEECFGKTHPCHHILMNKNEMNIAFNGDVTININNGKDDDELVEFQQIDIYEDPKLNELVFNSLNGEPSQLADIIYYYYTDTFNYGEDEEWYIYENHKWKNIGKKNNKLRYLLQPKLKELYLQLLKYYKENDYDKNKLKTLKNVIKTFGETTQKNNVLTELIDIYLENKNPKRDFTKKLDSKNYLIGFNNGVYDLNNFEFREGESNDYITMSVGYDYNDTYTHKYNDLIKFLEDIQPNKEEREYMLTYLSIGLIGNQLELFTILTGCGRNGKSKLIELLKTTFGDYFGSVQSQMFTRSRPDANSPDPGLLSLMKKKIIIASEPEKNSKLNSGFIKFITGRDSTTLRNCHSNDMIDFTANFITLLICNDIPECDDIDNAFSKRLRCLNFPTEFVTDPAKENQKKIDVNININFEYWRSDFMLLLIKYYKKYAEKHELKATNNILKWTNQYQEETDLYLQFVNECTEENNDDHIHCSTLYESFKNWFKVNNPNTKIPSNKEFVNNLRKYKEIKKVIINEKVLLGIKNLKLITYN